MYRGFQQEVVAALKTEACERESALEIVVGNAEQDSNSYLSRVM